MHYLFRIGDAFVPGEPLSEWAVVVAMAANDLADVNTWLVETNPGRHVQGHLYRLGLAHFYEIGENLQLREREPTVAAFIHSMRDEADGYRSMLDAHQKWYTELCQVRHLATFHYPKSGARSRLSTALEDAAESNGAVSVGENPLIRRFEFADEIMAALFTRCAGGDEAMLEAIEESVVEGPMLELFQEVSGAITEFDVFAHNAIAEFVVRRAIPFAQVEPLDPDDVHAGWRLLNP
jgi:hypothetical protein